MRHGSISKLKCCFWTYTDSVAIEQMAYYCVQQRKRDFIEKPFDDNQTVQRAHDKLNFLSINHFNSDFYLVTTILDWWMLWFWTIRAWSQPAPTSESVSSRNFHFVRIIPFLFKALFASFWPQLYFRQTDTTFSYSICFWRCLNILCMIDQISFAILLDARNKNNSILLTTTLKSITVKNQFFLFRYYFPWI